MLIFDLSPCFRINEFKRRLADIEDDGVQQLPDVPLRVGGAWNEDDVNDVVEFIQ